MATDLDALAVQVGREAVAQVVRDEPGQQPSPETVACVLAGRLDDRQAPRFAILGARAMLAKLREMGLVVEWRPIEEAPRDGSAFVGSNGHYAYRTRLGKYYDKWPHQDDGPTYREEWNAEDGSSIWPWRPTYFTPLPKGPGHD